MTLHKFAAVDTYTLCQAAISMANTDLAGFPSLAAMLHEVSTRLLRAKQREDKDLDRPDTN